MRTRTKHGQLAKNDANDYLSRSSELLNFAEETLVSRAGFEPATLCLKGRCSTD